MSGTAVKAGRSNFLHYNSGYNGMVDPPTGYAAPTWVVINRIGDLDRSNSKASTEVDMRASETTIMVFGNKTRGVTFTYYKKQGASDTVFNKLLASYEDDIILDIRIGETAPGDEGIYDRGPFVVSEFTKSEPIAGVDTYNITLAVVDAESAADTPYLYQPNLEEA